MERLNMGFNFLAPLPRVILQLPARGVEGIAYRHVDIGMGMVILRAAAYRQLGARHGKIDTYMIEIAGLMVPVLRFHHHPATHDLLTNLIQLPCPFLDILLHCIGTFHIAEVDL
jgi:hypothetical protein